MVFFRSLSLFLTTFGKTAGATKTQRQRNSAAGQELSTQKWQKQSGGQGQPPWAFAALVFSLSLSTALTLSLCCACSKAELQSSELGISRVDRRGLGG